MKWVDWAKIQPSDGLLTYDTEIIIQFSAFLFPLNVLVIIVKNF